MIMIPSNIAYFVLGFITCIALLIVLLVIITKKEKKKREETLKLFIDSMSKNDSDEEE